MSERPDSPATHATPPSASPPPGYVPYGPPAKASRSGAASKAVTSVMVSIFVLSIIGNLYAFVVFQRMFAGNEHVMIPGDTDESDRIAVIAVDGMITNDTAGYVASTLRTFEVDENLPRAIVLRIESGGGSVGASDRIWHSIDKFKTKHPDVTIVSSFGSVAASGGYYIATPTDYIFCEETGVTGSIGVMAQVFTADGLLEKVGVTPEILVADKSPRKDVANDITRPWNEADREVVRGLLNNAHKRFVDVVDQGRAIDRQAVEALATGDIFTAHEAVVAGLVDEVGYLDDAIAYAAKTAGFSANEQPRVTIIQPRSGGLLGALSAKSAAPSANFDLTDGKALRDTLVELSTPRLEYRWSALQP